MKKLTILALILGTVGFEADHQIISTKISE